MSELSSSELDGLLAQARQGDCEAFGELCRFYEARLLRHAIVLGCDGSLAEDLAQETLLEAWKCLARYNGRCRFFTWLCAILLNRHRNCLRRKRLLRLVGFNESAAGESRDGLDEKPSDDPLPDEVVQALEQAALVRKCVGALPARHQQVIYLRFFVDTSIESIAVALGCSVGTVKSRLFYALEKLRAMNVLTEQRVYLNGSVGDL